MQCFAKSRMAALVFLEDIANCAMRDLTDFYVYNDEWLIRYR